MFPSVHMLGALGPDAQGALQNQVESLLALDEQALDDIILTGRQGADITHLQSQQRLLYANIKDLEAQIQTIDEGGVPAWQSQAAEVDRRYRAMLVELAEKRQRAATWGRLEGLWWGVGAVAAATALGYYVWFRKRERRRR